MLSTNQKLLMLKKEMILPFEELKDIDNNLLLETISKYGLSNYQKMEFLGDTVLDFIITDMIYNFFNNPGDLTSFKSKLVRNVSLICLMKSKNLCSIIDIEKEKDCADFFEAIIGAIYIHLKPRHNNPLNLIKDWLNKLFNFSSIIQYLIDNPNEQNVCQALTYPSIKSVPKYMPIYSHTDKLIQFYKQHGLTLPIKFEIIQKSPWKVYIEKPSNLNYYDIYIGNSGIQKSESVAKERASQNALEFLEYYLQ